MARLAETLLELSRRRQPSRASNGRMRRNESPLANPGALAMFTYAPANLPPGAPLVVVLHGCTQSAAAYADGAGWLALADRFGFAVLAPEQSPANNPNRCFNWFLPNDTTRGLGEAASISEMTALATTQFRCDAKRVFITGLSAGGAMTSVMLATYPELFRGGSVIAGLPFGAASSMAGAFSAMQGGATSDSDLGARVREATDYQGPWPEVMVWHGDADTTVRISAGAQVARQWTEVHGVDQSPVEQRTSEGRRFNAWQGTDGRSVVEFHRMAGMGHGTPVKVGKDGCGSQGAFLLDVGVSSSLETARRWGIDQCVDASSSETHSAILEPEILLHEESAIAAPPSGQSLGTGITAIINDALRKAGLLR